MKSSFFTFAVAILMSVWQFNFQASAQCTTGESKVLVQIRTDNYGYETYWRLTDMTSNQVILSGGNIKAFPGGTGNTAAGDPGAYPNNVLRQDSICVTDFSQLKFVIFDAEDDGICCSYGNGYFRLFVNGTQIYNGGSFTRRDSVLFTAPLPGTDVSMQNVSIGTRISVGKHFISGSVRNNGISPINSLTVNWAIDNGVVRSEDYTGLNLQPGETYKFSHKFGWEVENEGSYAFKAWVTNINGGTDDFPGNDEQTKTIQVFKNKRVVLVETWTNAGCGPCAAYVPRLEEILDRANHYGISISYHSNWPGVDSMNLHNPQQVSVRGNFYGISSSTTGYPSSVIDGGVAFSGNSGNITENMIYNRALVPSDFEIVSPTVTIVGDTLFASADIKTNSVQTGNYRAHIVVVEREILYNSPPGSNGQKDFDWVMKHMISNTSGIIVPGTFLPGDSVNISGSWKMANVYKEEELGVVFFIQNYTGKEVLNATYVEVREQPDFTEPEPEPSSVLTLKNNGSIKTYPNPTRHEFNIEMTNIPFGNLNIGIFNIAGQQVSNMNMSNHNGNENILISTQSFPAGLYIVRISGDGFNAATRLMVER